ncbi:MAG TPA: outer membrane protein assembly factor BamD [Bryobacteraceae bacterium]|jgi:outer membrane protein assembly factor BamD|nr:outer membrane protein assembly factor BamD [Bryobacteraceae bacterium]
MMVKLNFWPKIIFSAASVVLLSSCVHKYATPITKKTEQPDKVLFDSAMRDIERGRYETARISLQTLMNTYESSEFLAKAKLAIADSWYREGGANGMAQAEAEYKDFELFYPQMEESAEAQNRICMIHFGEMDKSDRDDTQALRAQEECKDLLIKYPNSKFAPKAADLLRQVQESLAAHEFAVGNFYWLRDMNPAAANRLNALVDQFPLYSKADEALYEAGDAYSKMGTRYRQKSAEMFQRIVREYPMGERVKKAKDRLAEMEMPIPEVDKAALDRANYNKANYKKPGLISRSMTLMFSGRPDTSHASKIGDPTMTDPKPTIPVSVPVVAEAALPTEGGGTASPATAETGTGNNDVTIKQIQGPSKLDTAPDARPTGGTAPPPTTATPPAAAATTGPLPTNRDAEIAKIRAQQAKKLKKMEKKKKNSNQNPAQPAGTTSAPASGTPAATNGQSTQPAASAAPAPAATPPQQ